MSQIPGQTEHAREGLLSGRELAALTLVARGHQTSDVAVELDLDERQADALLRDAQVKLGATNRANAVALAIRRGLIGIEA